MLKNIKSLNELLNSKDIAQSGINAILTEGNLENILNMHTFAKDINAELIFLDRSKVKKRDISDNLFEKSLEIAGKPKVFIIDKLDSFPPEMDIVIYNLSRNEKLNNAWVFVTTNKQCKRKLSSILIEKFELIA